MFKIEPFIKLQCRQSFQPKFIVTPFFICCFYFVHIHDKASQWSFWTVIKNPVIGKHIIEIFIFRNIAPPLTANRVPWCKEADNMPHFFIVKMYPLQIIHVGGKFLLIFIRFQKNTALWLFLDASTSMSLFIPEKNSRCIDFCSGSSSTMYLEHGRINRSLNFQGGGSPLIVT